MQLLVGAFNFNIGIICICKLSIVESASAIEILMIIENKDTLSLLPAANTCDALPVTWTQVSTINEFPVKSGAIVAILCSDVSKDIKTVKYIVAILCSDVSKDTKTVKYIVTILCSDVSRDTKKGKVHSSHLGY